MKAEIPQQLYQMLEKLRAYRQFNVKYYVQLKIEAINKFFAENKLDSCVIGLSGGVDSAIVYKLFLRAAMEKGSPIRQVKGVFLPINTRGITGQSVAEGKVKVLCNEAYKECAKYNKEDVCAFLTRDLTPAVRSLYNQFYNITDWTMGQMACIVRTPALYGEAAYMQQLGFKSLVVGTTNYDEGSYIGFFGKASDAMVDLQPIADIHKSEVYEVAEYLKVSKVITNDAPKGDVWDGRVDEEMIGAPYWFLELYLMLKYYWAEKSFDEVLESLHEAEKSMFLKYAHAIETIHSQNKHKYVVGSPAHFLNITSRPIKGGWQY